MNVTNQPHPTSASISANRYDTEPDWQVLVLFTDDTENDIKGIWGPYTDFAHAEAALDELRQWPLDGYWDVRRLNKFVAAKSGNPPNQLRTWTWNPKVHD